ncbi:hypothetical protein ACWIYZ_01825 [Ursidibacter arcticus]
MKITKFNRAFLTLVFGISLIGSFPAYAKYSTAQTFLNNAQQLLNQHNNNENISLDRWVELSNQALDVSSDSQEIIQNKLFAFANTFLEYMSQNEYDEAFIWGEKYLNEIPKYKSASSLRKGTAIIQRIMGRMYFDGISTNQDKKKGLGLIKKACQNKDQNACNYLKNLK